MPNISPVSNFVPSGSPSTSTPTGSYGIGVLMNLPAVDSSNAQMAVTNAGEHTLQVNIGANAPVPYSFNPPASLRIKPNKTVLLTGLDALAAAVATQVSVSSSAPGCVATFQRGSLTITQQAA